MFVPLGRGQGTTGRRELSAVGTLGVIGPTRMAYDRMIQIVDITSRLVSNALSQK